MYSPTDYYYKAQPSTLGTPHPSGDQSRARGGDDLRTMNIKDDQLRLERNPSPTAHQQGTQDTHERRTPDDNSPKVRALPPPAPTAEPRRLRPSSPFSC